MFVCSPLTRSYKEILCLCYSLGYRLLIRPNKVSDEHIDLYIKVLFDN